MARGFGSGYGQERRATRLVPAGQSGEEPESGRTAPPSDVSLVSRSRWRKLLEGGHWRRDLGRGDGAAGLKGVAPRGCDGPDACPAACREESIREAHSFGGSTQCKKMLGVVLLPARVCRAARASMANAASGAQAGGGLNRSRTGHGRAGIAATGLCARARPVRASAVLLWLALLVPEATADPGRQDDGRIEVDWSMSGPTPVLALPPGRVVTVTFRDGVGDPWPVSELAGPSAPWLNVRRGAAHPHVAILETGPETAVDGGEVASLVALLEGLSAPVHLTLAADSAGTATAVTVRVAEPREADVPAGVSTAPRGPAVESAIRDYLLDNPEVLREALDPARQLAKRVADRRDELVGAADVPALGDPSGAVTVVEFFDYRCGYCKRSLEAVRAALLLAGVRVRDAGVPDSRRGERACGAGGPGCGAPGRVRGGALRADGARRGVRRRVGGRGAAGTGSGHGAPGGGHGFRRDRRADRCQPGTGGGSGRDRDARVPGARSRRRGGFARRAGCGASGGNDRCRRVTGGGPRPRGRAISVATGSRVLRELTRISVSRRCPFGAALSGPRRQTTEWREPWFEPGAAARRRCL